jgi:hypothetical protein
MKERMKKDNLNNGLAIVGIIIVIIIVTLFSGGLYYYLSKQLSETSEISNKKDNESIQPTNIPSLPEESKEEEPVIPEEEVTPSSVTETPCQNECSSYGLKTCSGNSYKICGNYDTDSCLEWSSITACSANTICQNGNCVSQKCSDGTSYSQCSTSKPKYCEDGNLVDRASLCGCPQNYKIDNEKCSSLLQTNEIIIFREQNQNELLTPLGGGDDRWSINVDRFVNQFYQIYGDYYDFIALYPTKIITGNYSYKMNYNIYGIGQDQGEGYTYTKKLKSVLLLDHYWAWTLYENPGLNQTFLDVIIHEIGHYWCCFITGVSKNGDSMHWPSNLDLFNGSPNYVDFLSGLQRQWIIKGDEEICVQYAPGSVGFVPGKISLQWSNLSLYLMGLIPPEEVSPISVHEFEEKPDNPTFNTWGPNCGEEHKFTETKTITIQDIIRTNGKRVPSYKESQKDFRIAFVILTPKDTDVPSGFTEYINKYKEALPGAWSQATVGKSSISF